MYKVILFVLCLPLFGQAKVIETTLAGRNALVYLPADYDQSKSYPVMLYHPETGIMGPAGKVLRENGPFKYITDSTDLQQELIIVAVMPDGPEARGREINSYINAVKEQYKVSGIVLTGIGGGNHSWIWYAFDSENDFSRISAFAIASGQPDAGEFVSRHPDWFEKYGVHYWGFCGTADPLYDNQKNFFTSIKKISPSLANWTDWNDAGHGNPVWSEVYNPSWSNNENHTNLYAWAVSVTKERNEHFATAENTPAPSVNKRSGDAFEMVLTRAPDNTAYIEDASYIKPGSKIILTGRYKWIQIKNLNGTPEKPITIINKGQVVVGGFQSYTMIVTGSNFKILGNGNPSIKYGIKLDGGLSQAGMNNFGIAPGNSSNVEIAYCEFSKMAAGIFQNPIQGNPMENCFYHHNYFHDFDNPKERGRSEGFYLGNTKGQSSAYFVNCRIEDNLLERLSGDGIQVCNGTFSIKNNVIKKWGQAQLEAQDNGILVGGFCSATVTGNHLSDGTGIGFQFLGSGNNTVSGNVFENINTTGGTEPDKRDIIYINAKSNAKANLTFSNNEFINVKPGRKVIFNGTEGANIGVFRFENNKGVSRTEAALTHKDTFVSSGSSKKK